MVLVFAMVHTLTEMTNLIWKGSILVYDLAPRSSAMKPEERNSFVKTTFLDFHAISKRL